MDTQAEQKVQKSETSPKVSRARKRELGCCGQKLLRFEFITKSDPTPFGP